MNENKFLLVAINSKYIHSNPAVYCLKSSADKYSDMVEIKEYTINNHTYDILRGIYEAKPDIIGFSCYIWNISLIDEILFELEKILPDVPVWLGGPEVSYHPEDFLKTHNNVSGVMRGEGESVFPKLLACYADNTIDKITNLDGVSIRDLYGNIVNNPCPKPVDLNDFSMPYHASDYDGEGYKNRIIYYESSRGCPFSCSYCLSSVDKKLRFRNPETVKKDLLFFIEKEVPQVKFVDRTFNCNKNHAMEIWRFIKDNDRGITNFHFEIAADLLTDEEIEILNSLRPGLVQLEVGIQSTNPHTIEAIHRSMNLDLVADNIKKIKSAHNIHVHLDLIAGLPYEDIVSFEKSFNDVYRMEPDALQLGFLKLLYGSPLRDEADGYGIVAQNSPLYEVLFTKWVDFSQMIQLKLIENVLDMYYNSKMFVWSIKYLISNWESEFKFYSDLGKYYDNEYPNGSLPSKNGKYELLYRFGCGYLDDKRIKYLGELLKFDMFCRENIKSLPSFLKFDKVKSDKAGEYAGGRKLTKAEHIEIFDIDIPYFMEAGVIREKETAIHFDYMHRDNLFNNALIVFL